MSCHLIHVFVKISKINTKIARLELERQLYQKIKELERQKLWIYLNKRPNLHLSQIKTIQVLHTHTLKTLQHLRIAY